MEVIKEKPTRRKFYRSRKRIIGGVCAGIADYIGVSVVWVRIIALILLVGSFGLSVPALALIYTIFWVAFPLEPGGHRTTQGR